MATGEVSIMVRAQDGATRVLAGIDAQFRSFASGLKGLAGSLGVGIGFGAAVAGAKALVSELGNIADSAEQVGISTDSWQALRYAATQTGQSMEKVEQALIKVQSAQANVGSDKKLQDAFRALNIDVARFVSLKPDDALAVLGQALNGATDKTEAFSAVTDIFGEKVGPRMMSMLKQIAGEGFDPFIAKAIEAGQVSSKAAIEFADTWDSAIKSTIQSYKSMIVNFASGGLQKAMDDQSSQLDTLAAQFVKAYDAGVIGADKLRERLIALNREGMMPDAGGAGIAPPVAAAAEKQAAAAAKQAEAAAKQAEAADKQAQAAANKQAAADSHVAAWEAHAKRMEERQRAEEGLADLAKRERQTAQQRELDEWQRRDQERQQRQQTAEERLANLPEQTFEGRRAARDAAWRERADAQREADLRERMATRGTTLSKEAQQFLEQRDLEKAVAEAQAQAKIDAENIQQRQKLLEDERHKETLAELKTTRNTLEALLRAS